MISTLYNIFMTLTHPKNVKREFIHSYEEDKEFLEHFKEPQNAIQRSYYQYSCQKKRDGICILYFVQNILALLMLPIVTIVLLIRRMLLSEGNTSRYIMTMDLSKTGMLEDKEIQESSTANFKMVSLCMNDIRFLTKIINEIGLSPLFLLKCMIRIANYSEIIKRYHPQKIFCSCEYSFTSSILSMYCEEHNITHTNIMHGEKIFDLTDSFAYFHEMYIWDRYYETVFIEMKVSVGKYIVRRIKHPSIGKNKEIVEYTYYLQQHDYNELLRIKEEIKRLDNACYVRPHPLYTDITTAIKLFGSRIQRNTDCDIWESIAITKSVIAIDSSVLYQGSIMNKNVIVDDLTDPERYNELRKRGYIMLRKKHKLLSELIDQN